jgi:hypothetical protein
MPVHQQNKAWNAEEIFEFLVIVQSDILINALVSVRAQDVKWGAKVIFFLNSWMISFKTFFSNFIEKVDLSAN